MAAKGKTTDGTTAKTAAAPARGRRARAVAKGKPSAKDAASDAARPGTRRPAPAKGDRKSVV